MTKLPNINLNFQVPEIGLLNWRIDLDLNIFLSALKKTTGIELKSVAIPFLLKLVRISIRNLEADHKLKRLTKEGELELINQQ